MKNLAFTFINRIQTKKQFLLTSTSSSNKLPYKSRQNDSTCSMTQHPCILILADFAFSKNVAKVNKYFIISGCNISGSGFFKKELYSTVKCTLITGFYLGREGAEKLYH